MKATKTEFRIIRSLSNRDKDEYLETLDIQETPCEGQVVNINGSPYVVYSKSWAFDNECSVNYCYIDLICGIERRRRFLSC